MWGHGRRHLDMVLVTAVDVFLSVCGLSRLGPLWVERGVAPSSGRPSTQLGPALVAVGPSRRTCPGPSPPARIHLAGQTITAGHPLTPQAQVILNTLNLDPET